MSHISKKSVTDAAITQVHDVSDPNEFEFIFCDLASCTTPVTSIDTTVGVARSEFHRSARTLPEFFIASTVLSRSERRRTMMQITKNKLEFRSDR